MNNSDVMDDIVKAGNFNQEHVYLFHFLGDFVDASSADAVFSEHEAAISYKLVRELAVIECNNITSGLCVCFFFFFKRRIGFNKTISKT